MRHLSGTRGQRKKTTVSNMAVSQKLAERTERKLRPLYDAVDNGQNKNAIQLADKILKKENNLQCARALKAIALLRLGRYEESSSAIEAVLASQPGDQTTLQACTMYFKENDDYMKIAQMYADAATRYPKNQEVLTHLFMAYVRLGDYQKQQQTAVQLHKAFPKSGPYYCWRVMSILMQASDSQHDDKARQLYLPLAERLIDKYFAESKVESEAEVKLYLLVLDKLEKMEKKLHVLEGPPGERLYHGERSSQMVSCLVKLKRWADAARKLTEVLEKTPDEWSYVKQYIHCQIVRCREEWRQRREEDMAKVAAAPRDANKENEVKVNEVLEGSGEMGDISPLEDTLADECREKGGVGVTCRAESECSWDNLTGSEDYLSPLLEARDFLQRLAVEELAVASSAEKVRYPLRGPLLARMELLRQLFHNKMHRIPLELVSPTVLLLDYFSVFGSKGCVFDDLRTFLDVCGKVDNQAVLHFLQQVQDQVESDPVDFDCPDDLIKKNTDRLRRHSNLIQLQRYHGCLPYSEARLLEICHQYYQGGLKLGRSRVPMANQPADFYTILAGHIKLKQYQETTDVRHMWEAIFLLERARVSTPQISVLLMTCYGLVGACENLVDVYQAASVKHLQIDTIGYAPLRFIQSMGSFGFANQFYKSAVRFYYGASKEFSDYIIQAYKNGTFNMIEEFVECRARITHSFNFVNTLTEMNLLDMILSVHSVVQAHEFLKKDWIPKLPCSFQDYVNSLVDNRDLDVLDDWSPLSEQLSDEQKKLSFELECLWLRARLNLVKTLREAVAIAMRQYKGAASESQEDLDRHRLSSLLVLVQSVDDFRSTLDDMDKHRAVAFLKDVSRQGSDIRLPLHHPPPCLGFFFLQQGHGKIVFDMMRVVVAAAGEDDSEEDAEQNLKEMESLLKAILCKMEVVKTQIHPVPEELRVSMSQVLEETVSSSSISSEAATSEKVELHSEDRGSHGPLSDHPYDVLVGSRIDLETYVLFLQTLSHVLLLGSVCAEVLTPPPTSSVPKEGGKKKNRRKKGPPPPPPPLPARTKAIATHLKNFVSEVQQTLTVLKSQFHPVPMPSEEAKLLKKLKELYIGQEDVSAEVSADKKLKSSVCGTVLTSYDMSLTSAMELADSKLKVTRTLIDQFKTLESDNHKHCT